MGYTPSSEVEALVAAAVGHPMAHLHCLGINGKTTGLNNGQTTENNGKVFIPTGVVVHARLVNSISGVPSLSVGTSSGSSGNIMTATAMTGSNVAPRTLYFPLTSSIAIDANTTWVVNVTVAATGTGQTLDLYLVGFYQET